MIFKSQVTQVSMFPGKWPQKIWDDGRNLADDATKCSHSHIRIGGYIKGTFSGDHFSKTGDEISDIFQLATTPLLGSISAKINT